MGKHFGHHGRGAEWKFGHSDDSLVAGVSPGHSGDARLQGQAGAGQALGAASGSANSSSGDDVFVYQAGDGDAAFNGGAGDDAILLDSVEDGWTLHLRRGEILSD